MKKLFISTLNQYSQRTDNCVLCASTSATLSTYIVNIVPANAENKISNYQGHL